MTKKSLLLLFIILSSGFYLGSNIGKAKSSLGRWIEFFFAEKDPKILTIQCSMKSLKKATFRISFFSTLIKSGNGKGVHWNLQDIESISCTLGKEKVDSKNCKVDRLYIPCFEFEKEVFYFPKSTNELRSLMIYYK